MRIICALICPGFFISIPDGSPFSREILCHFEQTVSFLKAESISSVLLESPLSRAEVMIYVLRDGRGQTCSLLCSSQDS